MTTYLVNAIGQIGYFSAISGIEMDWGTKKFTIQANSLEDVKQKVRSEISELFEPRDYQVSEMESEEVIIPWRYVSSEDTFNACSEYDDQYCQLDF